MCGSVICFFHALSLSRTASVKQIGRKQKKLLPLLKLSTCVCGSISSPLKDREQYTPSLLDWLGAHLLEILGWGMFQWRWSNQWGRHWVLTVVWHMWMCLVTSNYVTTMYSVVWHNVHMYYYCYLLYECILLLLLFMFIILWLCIIIHNHYYYYYDYYYVCTLLVLYGI